MNKNEYMSALREALKAYPEETSLEIVEAFESHFEAGAQAGLSEASVINSLGSVEDVMIMLREEMGMREAAFSATPQEIPRLAQDDFVGPEGFDSDTFNEGIQKIVSGAMSVARFAVRSASKVVPEQVREAVDFDEIERSLYYDVDFGDAEDMDGSIYDFGDDATLIISGNADVQIRPADDGAIAYAFHPTRKLFSKETPRFKTASENGVVRMSVNGGGGDLILRVPSGISRIESISAK